MSGQTDSSSLERCEYATIPRCLNPVTHEVELGGFGRSDRVNLLCTEHARPKYHPPDLVKRGKVRSRER